MMFAQKRKLNFADKLAIEELAKKGAGCTEISRILGIHGQQVAGYVRTMINFGKPEISPPPASFQKGPPYAMWGPPPPPPPFPPVPYFASQRPVVTPPRPGPLPLLDAPLEARTLRNELASLRSSMAGIAAELRRLSTEVARMSSAETEALIRALIRSNSVKEGIKS